MSHFFKNLISRNNKGKTVKMKNIITLSVLTIASITAIFSATQSFNINETQDGKVILSFQLEEKEMKSDYDKFEYLWLAEGFELRLPEIAQKVGNYSFIKTEDF